MDVPVSAPARRPFAAWPAIALLAAGLVGGFFLIQAAGPTWLPIDREFLRLDFALDPLEQAPAWDVTAGSIRAVRFLCGSTPTPQRWTNLALHLLGAGLLFRLLAPGGRRIAALAALGWALQPALWLPIVSLPGRGPLLAIVAFFGTALLRCRSANRGATATACLAALADPLGMFALLLCLMPCPAADPQTAERPQNWGSFVAALACGLLILRLRSATWQGFPAPADEALRGAVSPLAAAGLGVLFRLPDLLTGFVHLVDARPLGILVPLGYETETAWGVAALGLPLAVGGIVLLRGGRSRRTAARFAPGWFALTIAAASVVLPTTMSLGGWSLLLAAACVAWGWGMLFQALARRSGHEPAVALTFAGLLLAALLMRVPTAAGELAHFRSPGSFREELARRRPENAADRVRQAAERLERRRSAEALAALEKVRELRPRDAEAFALRGVVARRRGRPSEARRLFEAARSEDPANLVAACGRIDLALARLDPPEAEALVVAAETACPGALEIRLRLGRLRLMQGRFDEALPHFEEILRRDPEHLAARLALAEAFLANQDPAGAARELAAVRAMRPDDPEADHFEAIVRLSAAATREATEAAATTQEATEAAAAAADLRAVESAPDFIEARLHGAATLDRLGRREEAVRLLGPAIEFAENPSQALHFRGRLHEASRRYREAVANYERVLELEPESVEMRVRSGWILAVHPDPTLRDPATALERARRLLADPRCRDPRAWDLLAAALAANGRFPEAIDAANRAIDRAVDAGREDLALDVRNRRDHCYALGRPYLEE